MILIPGELTGSLPSREIQRPRNPGYQEEDRTAQGQGGRRGTTTRPVSGWTISLSSNFGLTSSSFASATAADLRHYALPDLNYKLEALESHKRAEDAANLAAGGTNLTGDVVTRGFLNALHSWFISIEKLYLPRATPLPQRKRFRSSFHNGAGFQFPTSRLPRNRNSSEWNASSQKKWSVKLRPFTPSPMRFECRVQASPTRTGQLRSSSSVLPVSSKTKLVHRIPFLTHMNRRNG